MFKMTKEKATNYPELPRVHTKEKPMTTKGFRNAIDKAGLRGFQFDKEKALSEFDKGVNHGRRFEKQEELKRVERLKKRLYLVNTVDDDFIEMMNKRMLERVDEIFGDLK